MLTNNSYSIQNTMNQRNTTQELGYKCHRELTHGRPAVKHNKLLKYKWETSDKLDTIFLIKLNKWYSPYANF